MAEEKMRKSGKLVDLKKLEAVIEEDGDGTGFSFGLFIGISALGRLFSSTSHKTNNNDGNNSIRQR